MKINQVEELVGITKKNIRFYEEQGLLNPDRNPENGYRDYSLTDVDCLLKIKLLRKIDVPIEEIKKLECGSVTFKECMETQSKKLADQRDNTEMMMGLCEKMSLEVTDFNKIDPSLYLDELKQLEKGGAVFMDLSKSDVSKKSMTGAVIAAACFIAFMLLMIIAVIVGAANDSIPIPVLILFLVIPVIMIIATVTALIQRIAEIRKGEAYEARKY
ncbi:MAG: MerR family transcriptional regulator [Lachnospiraceae bacterium]|nr:MerR family transcriptional regulator [Lachnospiraceae bacterium]